MNLKCYEAINFGSGAWIDRWVQAHQILVSWSQTQATRDNRLTGTLWNAQYVGLNDVDAKSAYESTLLCQQNYPRWQSWDLTGLTQKWVNLTATNYGVVLWATNESTDGYDLRFYSSEAVAPNDIYRPYLQVTYSTETTTRTVYFLKDHLGSIRATVLDSATAPVLGYDDYDPWGYPLALRTKAIPNAYLQGASKNKFTGKERDDEFGLNLDYFGARYYDSQIGRWPTVDPLWLKHPDVTPYNYVLNNPLRLIDPNGKQVDFYDMLLQDQGLRERGYSEQVIADLHKSEARGVLLGAAIGIGGVLAAEAGSYLLGAALFNPVTTNQIGIAITEALSPGAENTAAEQIIKPGTLSNVESRKLYHQLLDAIPSKIDPKGSLKERALQAFSLRDRAKDIARDAMADLKAAASLPPKQTLRDLMKKAYSEGKRGDEIWQYILDSSTKSNKEVDKSLGLDR